MSIAAQHHERILPGEMIKFQNLNFGFTEFILILQDHHKLEPVMTSSESHVYLVKWGDLEACHLACRFLLAVACGLRNPEQHLALERHGH